METKKINTLKKKYLFIGLAVGLVFFMLGFASGYNWEQSKNSQIPSPVREHNNEYTFINPLLATSLGERTEPTHGYASIDQKIKKLIETRKRAGKVDDVSVYFINYKENGFFGINTEEQYNPASLLKVALMLSYLKQADDTELAEKKLTYTKDIIAQYKPLEYDPPSQLQIDKSYTISDLIEKMIVDSDNGAMRLLLANIDDKYLSKVYAELGLDQPTMKSVYTISAKQYAIFFRILYNSSYLSRPSSEKALALLNQTKFKDGLLKKLPEGIKVAHKFGGYVEGNGQNIKLIELHDCGIVYHPKADYLLCVMTRGKNSGDVSEIIGDISKVVFYDQNERN